MNSLIEEKKNEEIKTKNLIDEYENLKKKLLKELEERNKEISELNKESENNNLKFEGAITQYKVMNKTIEDQKKN